MRLARLLLSLNLLVVLVGGSGSRLPQKQNPHTGYGYESVPPYSFYRPTCDDRLSNRKVRTLYDWMNDRINPDPPVSGYIDCGLNVPAYGRLVIPERDQEWACLDGWAYMQTPTSIDTCTRAALIRDGAITYGVLTGSNLGIVKSAAPYTKPIYPADYERLAWLVDVEVKGFGQSYWTAGLSVLSTVFERIETKQLSDGTIKGTIARCNQDGSMCQFPSWVSTLSCTGIVDVACPISRPDDLIVARQVVAMYVQGYRGLCDHYLYYDSLSGGVQDCAIVAPDGSIEQFHNR